MVHGSNERQAAERTIRQQFESTFEAQVQRRLKTKIHQILPLHFFIGPLRECGDLFVSGHYYGCISLAQAVAERLSKFVAVKKKLREKNPFGKRIERLRRAKIIPDNVVSAFLSIYKGRDDYHHLNKNIPQDQLKLYEKALGCITDLETIESEIFAYTIENGEVLPTHKLYWPIENDNMIPVHVDFT